MTTDATQVTGSALSGGPRPGDVLAERYELLEALDHEGPSIGFRALDQETERPVLVRVLTSPGLHTDRCDEVVELLRGLVGVGGRFLSSLLDADREGRAPFTVESFPRGTQLAAILDARRGRGAGLGSQEVLPVVARLSAALAALPPRWHHGDVRPERVWLDTDGLRLTGAYLLAALPSDELAERIDGLGPGVVAYPPEMREGRTGPSGDLWGVASIAWEALTGRSPDPAERPEELGPALHAALSALLDPDPARRPADLRALLDALAQDSGLPVPRLDPEPHQPPAAPIGAPPTPKASKAPQRGRIAGAAAEGTQEVSFDQIMEERRIPKKILGAAPEGTQEISFDQIMEERPFGSPDDTAKHEAIVDEPDSFDPRLVRAALGVSADSDSAELQPSGEEVSQDTLDPRLVRAALGVRMDSDDSSLDELPSDELELMDVEEEAEEDRPVASRPPTAKPFPAARPGGMPAPRPFPAPRPAADVAPAPRAPSPHSASPGAPPRPHPSAAGGAPRPGAWPQSSAAPAGKGAASGPGAPRPQPASTDAPWPSPAAASGGAPPSSSGASSGAAPSPAPSPRLGSPAPTASTPRGMRAAETSAPSGGRPPPEKPSGGTSVVRRDSVAGRRSKRSMAGLLIVVGALVLAIAIVGTGFWIAAQRRTDAVRSRQIQERLQQLRPPEAESE